MTLAMKSVTSPTVTDGSFNVAFKEYEKVVDAIVSYDQSNNLDVSGQLCVSYNYITIDGSYNYVTIYAKQFDMSENQGRRRHATTAMLAGKKFVVIADCI